MKEALTFTPVAINANTLVVEISAGEDRIYGRQQEQFKADIEGFIALGYYNLVFALPAIQYINSGILEHLLKADRSLKRRNGGIKLAELNPSVDKFVRDIELPQSLPVYLTREEAVQAFQGKLS